jgi:hypothetical protein
MKFSQSLDYLYKLHSVDIWFSDKLYSIKEKVMAKDLIEQWLEIMRPYKSALLMRQ